MRRTMVRRAVLHIARIRAGTTNRTTRIRGCEGEEISESNEVVCATYLFACWFDWKTRVAPWCKCNRAMPMLAPYMMAAG